jgi:mutual gliding-motility protein MglA
MVFFNYATMQMAAKIVYYGPGLCGKTTNLHYIYGRTAPGSRGEMVSLETETDRTLFFDLLPLDVGVIGGFKTRVQLYTVPGQVFYNTTRKLVLKGVDGMVFVADSQRAMKEANLESFANLRSNLAEIGLKLDEIPLVFQYNKRDLTNILSLDELEESLNAERQYEGYEACAVLGQGVFETLKAISRLTLRSLKKRMLGEEHRPPRPSAGVRFGGPETSAEPPLELASEAAEPAEEPGSSLPPAAEAAPEEVAATEPEAEVEPAIEFEPGEEGPVATSPSAELVPEETVGFDASDVETVQEFEEALASLDSPLPEPPAPGPAEVDIGEVSFAETPEAGEAPVEAVKHVRVRSNIDILAELEKLRKNATAVPADPRPARRMPTGVSIDDLLASSLNHRKELNRVFEVHVPRRELTQGKQITVGLRFTDAENNPIGEERSFSVELQSRSELQKLLLSLKFHIFGK